MKTNLILHCGARAVDRDTLRNIPCPPATETWHPIPHIRMVDEVERALTASNMRIVNESFGVTEDNGRMFGLLQVANCVETVDYAYVIGLRGSLDKSLARGLAVGSSVFVCDNLAFSAEIVFDRRSTKRILDDLPQMVNAAIGQLNYRWNDQGKRIDAYKNTSIGNKDAAYLLAEIAGEVFPWQRFESIYSEFKAPRHPEFQKETLWALFNSVTEFLKPRADSKASGLWTLPARTSRLHKVCDDFAGVMLNAKPVEATPIEVAAQVVPVEVLEVVTVAAAPVEAVTAAPVEAVIQAQPIELPADVILDDESGWQPKGAIWMVPISDC